MANTYRKPKMQQRDSGIIDQQRKAARQSAKRSTEGILEDYHEEVLLDEHNAECEEMSLSLSYQFYVIEYDGKDQCLTFDQWYAREMAID